MQVSITPSSVLTSISVHGLVPRGVGHNCIPGENDPASNDIVCCNYFHPDLPDQPSFEWVKKQKSDAARLENQLHSLVHHEKSGIYPIAMERYPGKHFNTDAEFVKDLAERVQNTVCLILGKDALESKEGHPCFGYAEQYQDLLTHHEIRHRGSVPSKHIRFVLAPIHLAALAKQAFGERVIPVGDCKAMISLGLMHDTAPMIRFFGQEGQVTLIAPDYFQELKKLAPQLKEGVFTHVVRLPGMAELQKKPGEKKFLFTIALDQQDKIFRVASSSLFQIRKCCDPNEIKYHVVCKESDAAALKEIFDRPACANKGLTP